MIRVLDARFVTTATNLDQVPRDPLPEVAFVGRSNVGKSSMINTLAHRKKLVRVSNTPGRTRTLNFFEVTVEHRAAKRVVRLCDLPGYGFAKVSKAERVEWQAMISSYLEGRECLKVVVSIIDGEVGPTDDDVAMLELLESLPPRILVVATKLDRLAPGKRVPRVEALAGQLDLPEGAVLGFSAVSGLGVDQVWGTLLDFVES
jgi:GTP-binding protein